MVLLNRVPDVPTQAHNTRTYFEKHLSRQKQLGVQGFEIGASRLSRNDSRSLLEYVYPKHTLKPLKELEPVNSCGEDRPSSSPQNDA